MSPSDHVVTTPPAGACPSPHPVRGPDGFTRADGLELVGDFGPECWARCSRCGAWFWLTTDIGSRFEYVDAFPLERALAERAFVAGDLEALAQLLITHDLPRGPTWTTAGALVTLFTTLTPRASDGARAKALAGHQHMLWAQAAELFAQRAREATQAAPDPLAFAVDIHLPGYTFAETHEVGAALVLLPEGRNEILRLDPSGLVSIPLPSLPRWRASHDRGAIFAFPTPAGEALLVVHDVSGAGAVAVVQPSGITYDVSPLEGGWWQFVPLRREPSATDSEPETDRWIELRLPDATPVVKFRQRFASSALSQPARRFGPGWILSNLVADGGDVQALTLFDAQFVTLAASPALGRNPALAPDRMVTPIDDQSFWARAGDTLERWVRRDDQLTCVQTFGCRSRCHVGDRWVVDHGHGDLAAYGADGAQLWRWRHPPSGATYLVPTRGGVLVYDDAHAHLLGLGGHLVRSFGVANPDVRAGRAGTVYLKSEGTLWCIGEEARALRVPLAAKLETTAGDAVIMSLGGGRFERIGPDGERAGFTAPGARFSVIGTRGGPYVIEPGRIRVAAMPQS